MKKTCLFLLSASTFSLALATTLSNPPPPALLDKSIHKKISTTPKEDEIFISKYLGRVLYLASATNEAQYIEVTITSSKYGFKSPLKSKDGKKIKAIIYPNNYTPFVIDGPVGHYSYTVKVIATPEKGTFLDPGKYSTHPVKARKKGH